MKTLSLILFTVVLTACAVGPQATQVQPPMNAAGKTLPEKQRDVVECQAIAAQSAQGAGAWTSVAPVRAAIADTARDQYLAQCLISRGWHWNR